MSRRAGLDRGRVTDAAASIADAEGLGAVTIARVAAELGVKGPSLYNHVASREALLGGLAVRGAHELADVISLATAGRSGRDALLAAGRAYRKFATAYPGRYAAAGVRAPDPGDEALTSAGQRIIDLLHAALRGFDLTEVELVHAVRALRSALHGFVVLEGAGGFALAVDTDASFDAMVEMLAVGIEHRAHAAS